ncbi:MAG: hypothetical protein ACRD6R_09920, partial [Candidatus Polarisedimenticolia bacterium]
MSVTISAPPAGAGDPGAAIDSPPDNPLDCGLRHGARERTVRTYGNYIDGAFIEAVSGKTF